MHGQAAARMTVPSRREPLPVEEVERRLEAGQDRTWTLHNAGYTEESYHQAQGRKAKSNWWAEYQATIPERQRKGIWRKLARGKRAKINLGGGEHPLERENARKARMRAHARAIEMMWRWRG